MRAQVLAPDSHELVTGQDEQPLRHDDDDDDEAADMLEEGEEEEEGAMAVEAMLSQAGSEVGLARTLNKLVTKPRILVCTPSNAACDLLLEVCAPSCPYTKSFRHSRSCPNASTPGGGRPSRRVRFPRTPHPFGVRSERKLDRCLKL